MFDTTPGPRLAADVAAADGAKGRDGYLLVALVRACERLCSWATAVQMRAMAELLQPDPGADPAPWAPGAPSSPGGVNEFAADEIACALAIGRRSAQRRVDLADTLVRQAPDTLTALGRGDLDVAKAREIADGLADLDEAAARAVEAHVLPGAGRRTCGQLRSMIDRARVVANPDAARVRRRRAVAGRRVELWPEPDGMAALHAVLSAPTAAALHEALTRYAVGAASLAGDQGDQAPEHDDPGIDARRADALVSLCLGRPAFVATDGSELRADVQVVVGAGTLLGVDDEPGYLTGYGPIDSDTCREIAADGVWRRILTDPATGTVLEAGRTNYRPAAPLERLVRARDRTCRFPGCRVPAHRCDLDHTVPFPEGPTSAENLGALCRHHHRLKHRTRWQVTQDADATYTWASPTGHEYRTHPPPPLGSR